MVSVIRENKIWILIAVAVVVNIGMLIFGPRVTLDKQLYYTGDDARALLLSFDSATLHNYFVNEVLDLLFIMTYSSFLVAVSRKYLASYRFLPMLALAPGFFDLIETTFILYALKTGVNQKFFNWLGIATFLKWSAAAGVILVLVMIKMIGKSSPDAAAATRLN